MGREPEGLDKQQRRIWRTFMSQPGPEFVFRFTRNVERQGRDRTFSAEAFDQLYKSLMLFIGSRLSRYADEHNGDFPAAMNIRVRVSMDYDADEFNNDDLPWQEGGDHADPGTEPTKGD